MRTARSVLLLALLAAAQPASGQRLLEEWRVRPSAGAEALATGPEAAFWNPAQLGIQPRAVTSRAAAAPSYRAGLAVMDLRAPRMTGIDGVAVAGAAALDGGRTLIGVGYEHVEVSGIEETTTSPDGIATIAVAEDRLALAAAREVGTRLTVGALVQYTRLPAISLQESVIALGVGAQFRPRAPWPVEVAAMAAAEGDEAYWMAGVELASPHEFAEWQVLAEYGLAGGTLAPGITHRVAVRGDWRNLVEIAAGVAVEPDAGSRTVEPLLGGIVRLNRYSLGLVREQLPNGFGAAWSFRFGVAF